MAFLDIPEGILASAKVARAITRAENFMMISGSALEDTAKIEFVRHVGARRMRNW